MQRYLALMLTKLFQLQAISSVFGIFTGSVVALMAAIALQGYEWPISLWHLGSPV